MYLRGNDVFIHASSQTTAGVWIFSPPCARLDAASPDADVGLGVLEALGGSQSGVRHPAVWTGLITPLLKLAKVKSWATFAKNASCADAVEESGRITVIPTRNLGEKEGFVEDPAGSIVLDAPTPDALGAAAKRALGLAS
jgi:hypothetical protein